MDDQPKRDHQNEDEDDDDVEFLYETDTNMNAAAASVEALLGYKFRDQNLVEEALTHSSYNASPSYDRLEFLGDTALNTAVSNYVYSENPSLDVGRLSLLRSANVSTERLARVAVRHRLYSHVRHNAISLGIKIAEFVKAVEKEDGLAIYGGAVKPPKVLADIVESVAGAVYVDCGFDLKRTWTVFRALLEPLVTFNVLLRHPQPVTELFQLCQKQGKQVSMKFTKNGDNDIAASVFVEGKVVASSSSKEWKIAKRNVAKVALRKLSASASFKNHSNEIRRWKK